MSATYIHTKRKPGKARLALRFLGVLYFLLLAAAITYLWCFCQDNFTSTADFKISRQDGSSASTGLLQLALPGLSDSGSSDSLVAIGYIDSADLLLELEDQFNLRQHYSSPKLDYFFRLDPKAKLEDRLEYYRNKISAHYDKDSSLTVVTVTTFDPKLSRDIAATILQKAEAYINVINQNIATQQLNFVSTELDRAARNVEAINAELVSLQNQHNFINPDEAISANLKAIEEMRMEHLKGEAELAAIIRESPNSPRIEGIRSKLNALDELIKVESAKLSGPEKDRLNQLLLTFKQLEMKLDFAIRLRSGAEMMLEKNRVDRFSQSRFFTVIQNPYLPEDVSIPRRPYVTATILVLGILLFFTLRTLTKSVFERV